LKSFIVFNVIEESIIAIIAFIVLTSVAPSLLVPGMVIVIIGLVIFTLVKIYSYRSSVGIPVYDPLIGQAGISLTEFGEEEVGVWCGKVRVRGEVWKAQAQEPILNNTTVWVQSVEGLTLLVSTTEKSEASNAD
jgi:membrane-bound ClpP family serine protease